MPPRVARRGASMFKLRAVVLLAILLLGASGFYYWRRAKAVSTPAFRLAPVARGDLEADVTATGTLSAVTTVQVGTQVSGQVSEIHADFNDHVTKGELIARIDPTLQEQAVSEEQAALERSQADLANAQQAYDREKQLYDGKVATESDYQTAQYNLAVAQTSEKSAEIELEKAKRNLTYTNIYSPIDGIVVERNVDVGQTVAASLSAPQLFLIANDLSQMQILASVDESDIGSISNGQPVHFTVQAYPTRVFTGSVRQVRLQSTTTENVVSYTVVVSVPNAEGKLLPGMTATVNFVTGSASHVLMVPNAALRFRPTPDMLAEAGLTTPQASGAGATSSVTSGRGTAGSSGQTGGSGAAANGSARPAGQRRGGGGGAGAGGRGAGGSAGAKGDSTGRKTANLWYVDSLQHPHMTKVRVGISDGQNTQIDGPDVREGMPVIIGFAVGAPAAAPAASPFQPQRGGRFGGPF